MEEHFSIYCTSTIIRTQTDQDQLIILTHLLRTKPMFLSRYFKSHTLALHPGIVACRYISTFHQYSVEFKLSCESGNVWLKPPSVSTKTSKITLMAPFHYYCNRVNRRNTFHCKYVQVPSYQQVLHLKSHIYFTVTYRSYCRCFNQVKVIWLL